VPNAAVAAGTLLGYYSGGADPVRVSCHSAVTVAWFLIPTLIPTLTPTLTLFCVTRDRTST
jgi:hypothetical protein